tara:strand:+ start:292 stop:405 length:114 start_codon:yes stop_codon:yes gene_type:complete
MSKIINNGNKEAVMTYFRFKDGKVLHQETGAKNFIIK